jgi:hypothetical protein
MQVQTFKVLVGDEFPLDMLAHDYCFPADTNEAKKLLRNGPRQIMMRRIVYNHAEMPSFQLWKDSGCRVEEYTVSTSLSVSTDQLTKLVRVREE